MKKMGFCQEGVNWILLQPEGPILKPLPKPYRKTHKRAGGKEKSGGILTDERENLYPENQGGKKESEIR